MSRSFFLAACIAVISQTPALAQTPNAAVRITSTFADGRDDDWLYGYPPNEGFFVDTQLGNSAPALHIYRMGELKDIFGIELENRRPEWLLALKQGKPVRIGLDVKTLAILSNPLMEPLQRDLVVEFRDYDNPPEGYDYVSVWKRIGKLDQQVSGWTRLSALISDPLATNLPPGWGGTGAEDIKVRPVLPEGRTFADVLANADSVVFSTFKPGYAYGSIFWDVLFDNISIRTLER